MFVKVNNGAAEKFPYSIGELRKSIPNVSLPRSLPDSALNAFGVFRVLEVTPPEINERTQKRERNVMPDLVDGQWIWGWTAIDKTQDEITADTEREASNVRRIRTDKLKDTDWTQVIDAPVDQTAWAAYRQALRDITGQEGFPWTITWPTEPQ